MRTHAKTSSHASSELNFGDGEHVPVLLQSSVAMLQVKEGGTYIDGTLGGGGHARVILTVLGKDGLLIGIDKDANALAHAEKKLLEHKRSSENSGRVICVVGGFEDMKQIVSDAKVGHVDGILLDLGWGTHTLKSGRGFSFLKDEPLLMTYSVPASDTLTALDIVNTWSTETLITLFRIWGEEPRARKAAHAITEAREISPIQTTHQLVTILEDVIPRTGKIHPATRVFQALRIAVNREIEILTPALHTALDLLVPHGRLVIITFHSGEDRVVKRLFNEWDASGVAKHLTKKVIMATPDEKISNPRSRSAKLRVIEKMP
jgi:16S rRNA (cytosine1402-N4)-methyltransferase